ncbi:GNAT family N-acetyltransferase [Nostoc sp. FACHB-152]|uniref:GNAT family N-acetyltransferase n=1 Tax=unclassified Nostoc TaxID=2593658 RepID=UPI00168676DB|nr:MULTISPECIES: GNAT family N-acetyltransferase [unclassified Nostoc]MBD2449760.1 GNAT family N-acetyltransferase [Nostoc sp. FACHB-152]MBD2471152.1 GNAT family N-acetyltransferase [Nostoc sp. FACHB-145]
MSNGFYIVENETGQIVGFASGGRERTGKYLNCGELYAIYILQTYQRQGLGYRLMTQVATKLVKLGINSMLVWVLADNPACQFYQSLGGLQVDEKQQEFGKVGLVEIAYLFKDMRSLRLQHE